MRMNFLKSHLLIAACSLSLLLTGCGASASSSDQYAASNGAGMEWSDDVYEEEMSMGTSAAAPAESPSSTGNAGEEVSTGEYRQKLVYTYRFDFETQHFDESLEYLKNRVNDLGGYIQNSSVYGKQYRYSDLTIRIPAAKAADFLADTANIGEIISQETTAEDITLQYYDVESRLQSLHAQHDRLLELIDRAEMLSDIAELESQLSQVEYEISSYQTRMNVMKNQVDYVTIYINLNEVYEITPMVEDTFLSRIQKGLSINLRSMKNGLIDFAVWFITSLPFLLFYAVLIVLIILIIKPIRKFVRRRREAKWAKMRAKGTMPGGNPLPPQGGPGAAPNGSGENEK